MCSVAALAALFFACAEGTSPSLVVGDPPTGEVAACGGGPATGGTASGGVSGTGGSASGGTLGTGGTASGGTLGTGGTAFGSGGAICLRGAPGCETFFPTGGAGGQPEAGTGGGATGGVSTGGQTATGGVGVILTGGDGVGGFAFHVLQLCVDCGWPMASDACQERVRPIPLFTKDQAHYYACLDAQADYALCFDRSASLCLPGIPAECEAAMNVLRSGC